MTVEEGAVPVLGPGEALVRLHAATLNFRDYIFANNLLPGIPKEPDLIPLSCGAGVVEAVGAGVSRVKPGDRVVHDAIAALFRDDRIDPLIVIRWKDIYDALERALDAAETVANVIANIVVKNA